MKRIAIIGGGIAGLSAAYELEQQRQSGADIDYVLYEASPRLGGVLQTDHLEGCLVEAGPDSFLTEKPWASDLCAELGIANEIIGSNDAARKTYILVNNRLVPMPDGLMFLVPTKILPTVLSPLFSLSTKFRMAREFFYPPHDVTNPTHGEDETVAALVKRHYGQEMVERLADPLLSGVYGGEADQLSVRAVLPRFADMEAKYGSLGRAMLSQRKAAAKKAPATPRPIFSSLRDGMSRLVEVLATRLNPERLRTNIPITEIQRREYGWLVNTAAGGSSFDAVILATPTPAAAQLIRHSAPELAQELNEIRYSSSITVGLVYDAAIAKNLPEGFGFLVPHTEKKRMLACTFVHNKFPHRAPENCCLLRCFLGGSRDEAALSLSNDEILAIVRRELDDILTPRGGLAVAPLAARVYKWPRSMAQYSVGHIDRLERIRQLLQETPRLTLAGNGYRGIGVPDCIRTGREAAIQMLGYLGLLPEGSRGDGRPRPSSPPLSPLRVES
jgi:oxygen-dependent protoporphyrinogen oxidase